jgi:immune inhibitor A
VRSEALRRAPLRGELRVVVVLVDFEDQPMVRSRADVEKLFFSEGAMPQGSVKEYFDDVSGGAVSIVGEVVGPYRLPRKMSEYANGASGTGQALPNARTMARDAALAADQDVDFGGYDNNNDGFVDAFIVMHAGPGGEVTGNRDHIWSHKWVLSGNELDIDGTKIYAYLTVPEDSRIGVCCHELGHLVFGWPDLYDTDGSSSGLGNWCLMAGGSWNGDGDRPAHPSAWCKATQEWVSVVEQGSGTGVIFEEAKSARRAYRLWTGGQAVGNEYFLLEHRDRTGFDELLPGEGLLVYHVDESARNNSDERRYRVGLVQADNNRDLERGANRGDDGDPYPGSSGNVRFSDSSAPSSRSNAGVSTCVSVANITAVAQGSRADVQVSCGGAAEAVPTTVLQRGTKGEEVRRLQELLGRVPVYHLPVDGMFGPRTEAAVKAFQSTRGLTVDGIVGPQTWGALEAETG